MAAAFSGEMRGEPFWAKALVAAFALSIYFAAWALAEMVHGHRSAS